MKKGIVTGLIAITMLSSVVFASNAENREILRKKPPISREKIEILAKEKGVTVEELLEQMEKQKLRWQNMTEEERKEMHRQKLEKIANEKGISCEELLEQIKKQKLR